MKNFFLMLFEVIAESETSVFWMRVTSCGEVQIQTNGDMRNGTLRIVNDGRGEIIGKMKDGKVVWEKDLIGLDSLEKAELLVRKIGGKRYELTTCISKINSTRRPV